MKSHTGWVFVWAVLVFSIMLSGTFAGTASACTDTGTSAQGCAGHQSFTRGVLKGNYSYFPSGDPDDGKFLTVTGHGLETLAGTMIVAYLGIPAGQTSFALGIFDGDQGGLWDITSGSPDELLFTIYADPLKDGNGTAMVGQLSSFYMYDDDWFETTHPTGPDAMSPAGNYFYRVEMQWRDPALSNDSNSFKLRVDGQLSLSMERFGFIGAPIGGCDPPVGTGDPNPGDMNDPYANSYNGTWNFYFYLPDGTSSVTMREGDADSGIDTDSAETPNIDPDGSGPAQAEGANPGNPADDSTSNPGAGVPGNIIYSLIAPDGCVYVNDNPSGNMEWENFTVGDCLPPGVYEMRWDFVDGHNAVYVVPPGEMFADAEIPLPVENQPPVAEAGPDQGAHPGAKVSFDGSGSYDVDGTIVSYEWDLGDGSSASGALVEHAYASQGNYSVSLTVTDDDGATGTDSAAVSVYNIPPVAEAGSDAAGTIFTNFTFDGTGSYDMDGTIVSYCWDFGDGATGTGPVTGHAYSAKGMYTVTLTVQDDDGAMDSDTAIVYVGNFPPVAVSSYTTGFNALNGENVTLTLRVAGTKYFQVSLAITENGNITDSVSITRHPGSPNVQEKSCNVTMNSTKAYMAVISWSSDRNGDSPVWLFLNNGVIDIRLKYNFNAQHDGPTATRTEDLNSLLGSAVNSSRYVKFDGSRSYDPDGFIVSYAWDFGDGKSGYGAIAAHSYAAAGIFSASLTVVDNDGSNSVTYFTVNVSDTFKNPDDGDSLGSGSDISMNVHSIWAAGGGEAAAAILLAVFLAIGAVSGIVSYAKRTPKNRKNRNSAIFGGI